MLHRLLPRIPLEPIHRSGQIQISGGQTDSAGVAAAIELTSIKLHFECCSDCMIPGGRKLSFFFRLHQEATQQGRKLFQAVVHDTSHSIE